MASRHAWEGIRFAERLAHRTPGQRHAGTLAVRVMFARPVIAGAEDA